MNSRKSVATASTPINTDNMLAVSNYRNPCTSKSSSAAALIKLERLIELGDLTSEVEAYLAGNIYDRFNLASGYERSTYLMQHRLGNTDKTWRTMAKEMFCYYGVLVLGFSHQSFNQAIKQCFTDASLGRLTTELAKTLKAYAEDGDKPHTPAPRLTAAIPRTHRLS